MKFSYKFFLLNRLYKKMAGFYGNEESEKRLFLSLKKLNFKRNFTVNLLNKKLKIVIALDPKGKNIILKSPAFLKKSSLDFSNCCNEQYFK